MTRALLLALALLLLLAPAAAADPLIPGRPSGVPTFSGVPPVYEDERFPPYAYTFEGESQFNSIGHTPLYFGMNQLLVTKAWLLKLSLRIAEYALAVDFLTPLLDRTGGALSALRHLLWDETSPLVAGALSLSGLWAVLLYMRGRASRVWASLGGTVLIVMVTAAVLTGGTGWAGAANALSRDLSGQVYGAVDSVGSDPRGWGLVARSGDVLWRTLVYQPWVAGEFGSVAGEQTYGQLDTNSFLTKDLEGRKSICGDDRTRLKDYCPWWGNDYLPRRMVIAGWTFLATAAVGGAVTVLSGGIILAQLALLFLLALSPVWLLVALWWPEQGRRLLSALWLRALGALVMQAVLAVTLGVLLLLSLAVTDAFSDGWMLQSLLLTALAMLAFRYRTAWLEPLAAVPRRVAERAARAEGGAPRPVTARQAVTVSGGGGAPAILVPAYAGLAAPSGRADRQGTAPLQAESPGLITEPGRVELTHTERRLALFRSEMQVLREQIARSGTEADAQAWAPLPDPGANRRQVAAARERVSGLSARIPSQRPKE